jgi:hypothetical protein
MASSIFWIPIGIVFHYFISQFSWFGYLIQPYKGSFFSTKTRYFDGVSAQVDSIR